MNKQDKTLEEIQAIYEKFKGKTFTVRQIGYTREITVTICGYNENHAGLLLIGKLDNKKGIAGFDSQSSFDFIRNFDSREQYAYVRAIDIEKAYKEKVLTKGILKRKLSKEIN
jgi:predicted HTH transcriptional regulator